MLILDFRRRFVFEIAIQKTPRNFGFRQTQCRKRRSGFRKRSTLVRVQSRVFWRLYKLPDERGEAFADSVQGTELHTFAVNETHLNCLDRYFISTFSTCSRRWNLSFFRMKTAETLI